MKKKMFRVCPDIHEVLKYIAQVEYGLSGVQTENFILLLKAEGLSDTKTQKILQPVDFSGNNSVIWYKLLRKYRQF